MILADILASKAADTLGVLTTTTAWEEYAQAVLPDLLDAVERVHRATSGSGGCSAGACDEDNHSPQWHARFRAALLDELSEEPLMADHPAGPRPEWTAAEYRFGKHPICEVCGLERREHINSVYCPEWRLRQLDGELDGDR